MNTVTKAATVAGAGVLLLLGGGTTFAFWTEDASGGTGVIQAGTLDLGAAGGAVWNIARDANDDAVADATPVAFDPATQAIVPGDLVSFTQSIPVTLDGKNIKATFAAAVNVVAATTAAEDVALAAAIARGSTVGVTGATGALTVSGSTLTGAGSGTINISTTLRFPFGTSGQYDPAKLGDLDFAVDYTLTQAS